MLAQIKKNLPNLELSRIEKAFKLVENFKSDIGLRKTRSYLDHVNSILAHLLPFKPDEATVIAAILHEFLDSKTHNLALIEKEFGKEVTFLLKAIDGLRSLHLESPEQQYQNYKKLLLAFAKDLRVIILRLVDRLDIMEHIDDMPAELHHKIAMEAMRIYVPIAAHLGMYNIKMKLEDLAFSVLYSKEYEDISKELDMYTDDNQRFIQLINEQLKEILDMHNIQAEIEGRIKHKYSIYRKLYERGKSDLESIFDVFALRIILKQSANEKADNLIGKCYEVLGIIHRYLTPIPDRFKDYIARPKTNGYRSLHTTVLGLGPELAKKPVEIQIRTYVMHEQSQFGLAAHSLYKDFVEDQSNWIRSILNIQKELSERSNIAGDMEYNIFGDTIFVLSDNGQIYDMPIGSTALDFAYYHLADKGHFCTQVKINGIQMPLDYVLKNGDVVRIVIATYPQPKWYWISIVQTAKAKRAIQKWFKSLSAENLVTLGRNMLNKHLDKLGHQLDSKLSILRNYGNTILSLKERQDILELIARGEITPSQVIEKIFSKAAIAEVDNPDKEKQGIKKYRENVGESEILVTGIDKMPVSFAACCNLKTGDPIRGYVGRGKTIKIHHRLCEQLLNVNPERLIDVSWIKYPLHLYKFYLHAQDRIGLIADISTTLSNRGYNIIHLHYEDDGLMTFSLELDKLELAEKLSSALEAVKGVNSVRYELT